MPKQTYFNLPEDKQKRILDCAVDEFAEQGYRAASISRIVAAAGIAKGSFYQYFEGKEDIYGHVVDYAIVQRKLQISDNESVKLREQSLTQFIRTLFGSMIQSFVCQPKLLKIGTDFTRNQHDPAQKRIREKYKDLEDDYFQAFIRFKKAQGEINAHVDEDVLGNMLMGIGYLLGRYAAEHSYEALTEEYINDLMDKIEYILTNGIYNAEPGA